MIEEYGQDHEYVYWRPGTDEPVNILATVWEALGELYRKRAIASLEAP